MSVVNPPQELLNLPQKAPKWKAKLQKQHKNQQFKYLLCKTNLQPYKVPSTFIKFLINTELYSNFHPITKEQYKNSKKECKTWIYVKLNENNYIVRCNQSGAGIILNNKAGILSTEKAYLKQEILKRKRERQ